MIKMMEYDKITNEKFEELGLKLKEIPFDKWFFKGNIKDGSIEVVLKNGVNIKISKISRTEGYVDSLGYDNSSTEAYYKLLLKYQNKEYQFEDEDLNPEGHYSFLHQDKPRVDLIEAPRLYNKLFLEYTKNLEKEKKIQEELKIRKKEKLLESILDKI